MLELNGQRGGRREGGSRKKKQIKDVHRTCMYNSKKYPVPVLGLFSLSSVSFYLIVKCKMDAEKGRGGKKREGQMSESSCGKE